MADDKGFRTDRLPAGFFPMAGRAEIADCAPTLQLFPLQTALISSASTLTLEVSNTISSCKEWCYFSTC